MIAPPGKYKDFLPPSSKVISLVLPTNGHNNKTSSEVNRLYHIRYYFVKSFYKDFVNIRKTDIMYLISEKEGISCKKCGTLK